MRAKELEHVRKIVGLTQEVFGDLMGLTGAMISRYEAGITRVPGPVAKLALLMEENPEIIRILSTLAEQES